MNLVLFSGTSNPSLSQKIAKKLKTKLGDAEVTRFIDNECRVYIKEEVKDKSVFVIQSLSEVADQHLVELCLFGQALKSLQAKEVIAIIPWLGYSKQDKEFRKGEAVSAQLVAKMIEAAGYDRVITCELHSEKVIPYFHIPVTELSTSEILHQSLESVIARIPLRRETKQSHPNYEAVVVSPDAGGQSRSELFAKQANLPIVYLTKTRDLESGAVIIKSISASVTGKQIIIFDDIINTGSTAIKSAEYLKKQGAQKIIFLATHAVLAGHAINDLDKSPIDQIIVTDTITLPAAKKISKLDIVTVASLLSAAINR